MENINLKENITRTYTLENFEALIEESNAAGASDYKDTLYLNNYAEYPAGIPFDYYLKTETDFSKEYPEFVTDLFSIYVLTDDASVLPFWQYLVSSHKLYLDGTMQTEGFQYNGIEKNDDGNINQFHIGVRPTLIEDKGAKLTFYIKDKMIYDNEDQITRFDENGEQGFPMNQFAISTRYDEESNKLADPVIDFTATIVNDFSDPSYTYKINFKQTLTNASPLVGESGKFYWVEVPSE